jgi:hypothetical protein
MTFEYRHKESAVLTQAIEQLLRKLISFLVGKVSLVSFQEMVKYLFVEEIENKLRAENPKKNIPLSQLALLSGLDTRTLIKIRNSEQYRRPFFSEVTFLRDSTPGASILDVWSSRPPYVDETSGLPKILKISGQGVSFESLFDEFGKARGVTYNSLLERLVDSGSVLLNPEASEVSLVTKTYLPSHSKDRLGAIEMGFSAIGNLIDTVTRNINALESGEERFYQRGAWTYRLSEGDKSQLRAELRSLMEETDVEARKIIEKYESPYDDSSQMTAGISQFYFEETSR